MIYENIDEIDYENMDDLPLSDHVDWQQLKSEETEKDDFYELNWMFS